MTHLTINDDMQVVQEQCPASGAGLRRETACRKPSIWQWCMEVSVVAVAHHYASPWAKSDQRGEVG
ncbi:hypothetical protein [Novosphingobium sp. ZW T3_23]|uniref:hypothetical protein n=1 Tax=Novosphingobium sp. ZW T3_23 TaxID=3378084 RepID=UPI003851AAF9